MKKIILLVVLCFFSISTRAQEFKEVKTAQDVIDNYLLAIGGVEALKEVKSIYMKGKMASPEMNGENGGIEIYFSKKYVYLDIATAMINMKQAVDIGKKKGWTQFGTMVKDMKEDEIMKSSRSIDGTLWANYLNPDAAGIRFQLMDNEEIDGKEVYVVDLVKDSASILTAYFDPKTFYKVREAGSTVITNFEDFRSTGTQKIIMPYLIKNKTGDVVVSEIKFNSKIDKKLLEKPETEEKEEKEEK